MTEKFSRGFDHLIYIWGADHHGTVARVRNAAEAMGYDRDAVEMKLYSWVRFVRDGVEVSMSKRAGEFITLDDLLAEVGVDAARWFFASRAATTGIDFDIELAKKQSNENPVYYVQYAHARIASILRKAAEAGLVPAARVAGALGGRAGGRARPGDRPVPRGRRGRRRGRGDAGRSPPTRPSWRRPSTPSTATRASSTWTSRSARRRGWRSPARPRSRSRTRSRCSGSPRPSRCRRPARTLPGEAEDAGDLRDGRVVRADDDPAGRPARARHDLGDAAGRRRCAVVAAASNSAASASVSQTVCMTTAHAPSGPSMTARRSPPQPAAALGGRGLRDAAVRQPDPHLELAERVDERHGPAGAEVLGEVGRELDVDRLLVGRVLLRVQDLLGRVGHPVVQGVDRRPSRRHLRLLDEQRAGRVRVEQRLAQDRGHLVEDGLLGSGRDRARSPASSAALEVLERPERHQQRGVALEDAQPGQGPVALVADVLLARLKTGKCWSWSACVNSWA